MTAENQSQSLEQLIEAVGQLALTLDASERRRAALSKRIRWGAAAAVVMLVFGASISFDNFKSAYAANGGTPGSGSCDTLDCQIQPISEFFQMMNGLMGGMMQSPDVRRYMYQKYGDLQAKVNEKQRSYAELTGAGSLDIMSCGQPSVYDQCPEGGNQQCRDAVNTICGDDPWIKQALRDRFPALAGQTVVDMALLVRRLRADSDEFRDYLNTHNMTDRKGGPIAVVAEELQLMNRALGAVPIMASEMSIMNRQMSVMSHSVGSTMGWKGNNMPW